MATKKAAAKKTTKTQVEPEPQLSIVVDPLEPRANIQFTVSVSDLEAGDSAELTVTHPQGRVDVLTYRAGPSGNAYWLLTAPEAGDYDLSVAVGDKSASETLTVS